MNDQAQLPSKKSSARELLQSLQERHAAIRKAQPLAIGIDAEILAADPEIDPKLLRAALRMHTGSTRYLKATARGDQRFNLAGDPVAELSPEHRARAQALLDERNRRRQEEERVRREAEAQARRAEKLEALAARFSRER